MTLTDYLEKTGESGFAFAQRAGVSQMTVTRARRGRAVGYRLAKQIHEATGGDVSLDALCLGDPNPRCHACGRPLNTESPRAAE